MPRLRHAPALMSIALLLTSPVWADGYSATIESQILLRSTTTADGSPIVYPRTESPEVTVAIVTIPKGAQTGWHQHPVPLYAYMLEGSIEVELADGSRRIFSAGEPVLEVVNTAHNGRGLSDPPARLVAFYIGEQGTPLVQALPPPSRSLDED